LGEIGERGWEERERERGGGAVDREKEGEVVVGRVELLEEIRRERETKRLKAREGE